MYLEVLTSQCSVPTLQGGPETSYFPVFIPYTTLCTWKFLLPSVQSLHYRVDLKLLTSQCSFPTLHCGPGTSYFPMLIPHTIGWSWNILLPVFIPPTTGWTWNFLLPSDYSLHYRVDLELLTFQWSFPTLHCVAGTSYFPVLIPHTTG